MAANQTAVFPKFAIQADHPRNCDLLIQSLKGLKLRSTLKSSWEVAKMRTEGMETEMVSKGGIPAIPGQILHVDPSTGDYTIEDPLYQDETLCDSVRKHMKTMYNHSIPEMRGMRPVHGKLDEDEMKTLCREIVRLVEIGDAKKVKGAFPKLEDVDEFPGHYLQNPMQLTEYGQPKYEKDMPEWRRGIEKQKG